MKRRWMGKTNSLEKLGIAFSAENVLVPRFTSLGGVEEGL